MDITVIGFRQGIPVPALQEALEQQNPDVVIEYPDEAWDYQVALDYSEAAWSLEYSKDATLLNGIGRLITNDQPIDDYGLSNDEYSRPYRRQQLRKYWRSMRSIMAVRPRSLMAPRQTRCSPTYTHGFRHSIGRYVKTLVSPSS
jgi:hypothetical protein